MDLKPENICMEMKGGQTSTWVVDYGSAMQQDTGADFVPVMLGCVHRFPLCAGERASAMPCCETNVYKL